MQQTCHSDKYKFNMKLSYNSSSSIQCITFHFLPHVWAVWQTDGWTDIPVSQHLLHLSDCHTRWVIPKWFKISKYLHHMTEGYFWLLEDKFCNSEFSGLSGISALKTSTPTESENWTNNPPYQGIYSKSNMGFPLVPKLTTFNDPEWCNGHDFELFHQIRQL